MQTHNEENGYVTLLSRDTHLMEFGEKIGSHFVNPTWLPLLCRNSTAVALAELGLMAGWLADKMWVKFKFLKFIVDQIFKLFAAFNTVTALLEQYECI